MSHRMLTACAIGLGLVALIGCGATESPSSMSSTANLATNTGTVSPNVDTASGTTPTVRQVILHTEIEISVEDLAESQAKLRQQVLSQGATITDSRMTAITAANGQSAWTIRVAPTKYELLLTELETLGDIQHRRESSQDVTAEAVDLEARIRNKSQEETRLLTHLNTSTGNLEEILRVEKEISRVREELERMQGQRAVLKDRVDWATIVVTLIQSHARPSNLAVPFLQQVHQTWTSSWTALMVFCRAGTIALIAILPWALFGAIPAVIVWGLRRRGARPISR